jgi:hypothetical protein
LNFGGTVLKSLFGVAVKADVYQLHWAIDKLKMRDDIVHSLADQLSYVRNMESVIRVDTAAITNLSSVVKDFMLDSHGKYFELAKEIIWLNLTLYNRSEVFMAIRQLEFSVLQLSRQIDDLLAALQYVFLGKMPLSFMGPEI